MGKAPAKRKTISPTMRSHSALWQLILMIVVVRPLNGVPHHDINSGAPQARSSAPVATNPQVKRPALPTRRALCPEPWGTASVIPTTRTHVQSSGAEVSPERPKPWPSAFAPSSQPRPPLAGRADLPVNARAEGPSSTTATRNRPQARINPRPGERPVES